jgi:hypothetical protein
MPEIWFGAELDTRNICATHAAQFNCSRLAAKQLARVVSQFVAALFLFLSSRHRNRKRDDSADSLQRRVKR